MNVAPSPLRRVRAADEQVIGLPQHPCGQFHHRVRAGGSGPRRGDEQVDAQSVGANRGEQIYAAMMLTLVVAFGISRITAYSWFDVPTEWVVSQSVVAAAVSRAI
jgi:hypothetical protein